MEATNQNLRALVLDDCRSTQVQVLFLLSKVGIQGDSVGSIQELRETLRLRTYDLLIIDIYLPDGDGLSLLRDLRADGVAAAVVLITGESDLEAPTSALFDGADGFMAKQHFGQGPEAFFAVLEKAISHREKLRVEAELQSFRDQIHSFVAHDLRAPAVQASMALDTYLQHRREELLEIASGALSKLFLRLDRLLDVTSLGSSDFALKLKEHSLVELLLEAKTAFAPLAELKQQELRFVLPEDVCTAPIDWDWMSRSLENLVENALKFTPSGGKIEVTLKRQVADESFLISVADNGPGLPPAELQRVFRPYYRAPGESSEKPGSGLGLSLVKTIVEQHGGRVWGSCPGLDGKGTTFSVEIKD